VTALRRLSSLPPGSNSQKPIATPELSQAGLDSTAKEPTTSTTEELSQVLLFDTESYLASLLFKPELKHRFCPPSIAPRQQTESAQPARQQQDEPSLSVRDLNPLPPLTRDTNLPPYSHPYSSLSPALVPSSSRAWATAAYLYLHVTLEFLWNPLRPVDQRLLRWLLDVLRSDIARTEEAMRLGAYSSELWLWKTVVGAYALTVASVCPEVEAWETNRPGGHDAPEAGLGEMVRLRVWFDERIRSWTQAQRVTEWAEARRVLAKIAWLQTFEGEQIVEKMWRDAVVASNA